MMVDDPAIVGIVALVSAMMPLMGFAYSEREAIVAFWMRCCGCIAEEGMAGVKCEILACLAVLSLGGIGMGDTAALIAAKKAKKDEFYTQRVDIENLRQHEMGGFW